MFCKNCGTALNPGAAVCTNCGVAAGMGTTFCANCGATVTPGAAVCTNCGVAVAPPVTTAPGSIPGAYLNGKDKMTIALLCFFLGGFGVHNFMLGEQKKGIVKIVATFLCGIGGILALIDFIKILTDKYVVDPNAAI